jgi:DNA ligase 1
MTKPQLAVEYSKVKNLDLSQGYYASPKLDGLRCLVLDGVAYSRSMKPFRNKEIQKFAQEYAQDLQGFDGELISGSPTSHTAFRDSTSVVMSEDGGDNFTFYVFDCIRFISDFSIRWELTNRNVHEFNHPQVIAVEHILIHSVQELLFLEQKYLDEGYEGIMLNSAFGKYKEGRSGTKNPELIKKKLFSDSEFKVVGYECLYSNQNEAKKDNLGHTERSTCKEGLVPMEKLGALKLITPNGKEFSCGSGFDDATRVQLWKDREALVGKLAKVKYFEQGNYDVPRFPIFLAIRHPDDL